MQDPQRLRPVLVGTALAATVAIAYTLCAAAWAIWNEAALDFLNALFHGLDFRKIVLAHREYGIRLYLYPLLVLSAWAFFVGALCAAIHNLLRGR
jgi:hypothetical protein